MALHGLVSINGSTLGGWSITRREKGDDHPAADQVFSYDVDLQLVPEAAGRRDRKANLVITHRYGDGAVALMAKAFAAAAAELEDHPAQMPGM